MEQLKAKKPAVNLWKESVWVNCENILRGHSISCCAGTEGSFHLRLVLWLSNIENPAVFFFIFQFWFWFCMLWTGRRIWNWRSKSAEEPRQHLLSNQAQRRSQWKKRQPKLRWKWPWLSRCALFFHEPLYLRWHHHRIPGAVLNLCWVFLSLISLSDQWCYGLVAFLFC